MSRNMSDILKKSPSVAEAYRRYRRKKQAFVAIGEQHQALVVSLKKADSNLFSAYVALADAYSELISECETADIDDNDLSAEFPKRPDTVLK